MENVSKKRGRKPKPKDPEDINKPRPRRGRRRKCEKGMQDASSRNIGFMKSMETIDISQNKIIMSKKVKEEINDDDYEMITYATGLTIRRKKVSDKLGLHTLLPPSDKKEDTSKCLIDLDNIEEEGPSNIQTSGKNKVMSLSNLMNIKSIDNVNTNIVDKKKAYINKKDYIKPSKRVVRVMYKSGDSLTEIPLKNDKKCWWCTYCFDTDACFVPTCHDEIRNRFRVTGNFCSWNCAKAYLAYDRLGMKSEHGMYIFTRMMKAMNLPIRVKIAPRREVLKDYGGILSIEEFRENFYTNDRYVLRESIIDYDDSISIIC